MTVPSFDLGGWDLVPWAAALHAVALPAAVAVAIARFRATVPPPVRWVARSGAAGTAATLLLPVVIRLAAPRAAATLGATFGPLVGLAAVALVAAFGWSLVERHFATGITAALLALALAAAAAPLSFMTTPGAWPVSRSAADALLNPTLVPLWVERAGVVTALCGACLLLCATRGGEIQRPRALVAGASLSIGGAALAAGGAWLWLRALGPAPIGGLIGEAPVATASVRVAAWAAPTFAVAAVAVAAVSTTSRHRIRRGAQALMIALGVAGAGGAEVARVALSGPWALGAPGEGWLYANGLTAEETDAARRSGLGAVLSSAGAGSDRPSAERGARLAGLACSPCHSERGLGARVEGWSRSAIAAAVVRLDRLSGASPPFPGNERDARDLADYLGRIDGAVAGTLQPPDPRQIMDGVRVFQGTCAHCHREIRLDRRVAGWNEPLALRVVGRLPRMNPAMAGVAPTDEEQRALAAYLVTLGARGR